MFSITGLTTQRAIPVVAVNGVNVPVISVSEKEGDALQYRDEARPLKLGEERAVEARCPVTMKPGEHIPSDGWGVSRIEFG